MAMKSLLQLHNTSSATAIPSVCTANNSDRIKTLSAQLHNQLLLHDEKRQLSINAVLNSVPIDRYMGAIDPDGRNPTLSTSFRNLRYQEPNQTVLEAQTRVCTGPTQTKPLTEEQAFKVLDTILRSAKGELKNEAEVSKAQLGAFFAAMTIRANAFPEPTQWSEGERRAMDAYWPHLIRTLPSDIIFLADPEGSIMKLGSLIGPQYVGNGTFEMRLVGALREVLAGGHLGYEEVQGVLKDVLPLKLEDNTSDTVNESLLSAFLIGQRMNRETDRELKAYCLAFDDELGNCTCRNSLGVGLELNDAPSILGKEGGITEEQMLKFMGANTNISPMQAKKLLEDQAVGFAYVSQREARPSLYSLIGLREHIKKRPPLATAEKVQQFVKATGKEAIVAGFYHEGYEEPLLMLMRRRGVHAGLVVKGEEGALSMTTKLRSVNASKGLPVNYCSGFRSLNTPPAYEVDGVSRESFSFVADAKDYGFEPSETPRTDRSVSKNIELGLAALGGEKGPAYDRIILNAAMADHLLGCEGAQDVSTALDRARDAIDSGKALNQLLNYIKISHKV